MELSLPGQLFLISGLGALAFAQVWHSWFKRMSARQAYNLTHVCHDPQQTEEETTCASLAYEGGTDLSALNLHLLVTANVRASA